LTRLPEDHFLVNYRYGDVGLSVAVLLAERLLMVLNTGNVGGTAEGIQFRVTET